MGSASAKPRLERSAPLKYTFALKYVRGEGESLLHALRKRQSPLSGAPQRASTLDITGQVEVHMLAANTEQRAVRAVRTAIGIARPPRELACTKKKRHKSGSSPSLIF